MHGRHLMKMNTTNESFPKADSSLDATLNPVELPSKEIVSWGVAFPRPATTLGVVGRMTAVQRGARPSLEPGAGVEPG
jgi:hypothetical protein